MRPETLLKQLLTKEAKLQILVIGVLLAFSISSARAERLPLKTLTVADGLASNRVNYIFQDRKRFIWFATGEGLSLFDGHGFRNFDESDGLPPSAVRFVTEDDKGTLWIGTYRGIARIEDSASFELTDSKTRKKKFTAFKISDGDSLQDTVRNQISRILFHPDGSLWCLTDYGLYKTANPDSDQPKFETIVERDTAFSGGAFRDIDGGLWFGLGDELFEISGSEVINRGSVGVPFPKNLITGIGQDKDGRFLVSDVRNLYEATPSRQNGGMFEFKKILSVKEDNNLQGLLVDADGEIRIATDNGLIKIGESGITKFDNFGSSPANPIVSLGSDRDGNLWVGLNNQGVGFLKSEAITNFVPRRDDSRSVGDVVEDSNGKIWAMLDDFAAAVIEGGELVERTFDSALPASPSAWLAKNKDRWNFSAQNQGMVVSKARLLLRNGRVFEAVGSIDSETEGNRFYEDESGVLWIAKRDGRLYRGSPDGKGGFEFESFPLETPFSFFSSRIISDGAGGLWLTHPLFLGRFRNGAYTPFEISDGLPEENPRSVFRDSRGWLWIGLRNRGVSVTEVPAAENPTFVNYSKTNSPLRSNAVRSIVEDNEGRMYFATDNGLSRFDLTRNEWTHFSSKTGLAGDVVFGVYKDSKGFVWASTESGLSRIDSRLERRISKLPPIYLTRVVIAGKEVILPETGSEQIPKLDFAYDENTLSISYVAPHFGGDELDYQFRLGEADWSSAGKERTISFSNLAAGSYRFEVRVVGSNGAASPNPAVFEFRIFPPVWQRWWFLLGIAVLAGILVYWLYRSRVSRLLEIERTRTRIATDLHDHIGTNLSKISLLSEIVRMQLADENQERTRMLEVIGETSRESVGAMSDIVWAINPQKDSLADMVRRMRRHAEEVFLEKGVTVRFNAPDDRDLRLVMEVRRELYLIFKEAVNNAAKHSECTAVEIDFAALDGLFLRVSDNGRGFDTDRETDGNGLKNLRTRAERIGADLLVESELGKGTSITVTLKSGRYGF